MKRFALTVIAASLAAGSLAVPALADSQDIKVDTQIVDINQSAGLIKLANGMTLDQSLEYFAMPRGAATGDKVRVTFTDTNELDRVVVIR